MEEYVVKDTDIIALEPICARCGEYFEMVPGQRDVFVEWRCGCRGKVFSSVEMGIVDRLMYAAEKSVFFNGFVPVVKTRRENERMVVMVGETADAVRGFVAENGLTDRKEELVARLKAIHLARGL